MFMDGGLKLLNETPININLKQSRTVFDNGS
jgi:hypothetical protein